MNGITEWLANLSWQSVVIIIIALLGLRYAMHRQASPTARSVAEIAESLSIAMGLVFLIIRPFFVQAFFIPSPSMVPTLLVRDHILVNKTVYKIRDPGPGEIVVFKAPPEATMNSHKQADFIKRVIGVPGDEIRVSPGYVVVDSKVYNHRDLADILLHASSDPDEIVVKLKKNGVYVDGRRIGKEELAAAFGIEDPKIEVHPGYVERNGKRLVEPYVAEDPDTAYPDQSDLNMGFILEKAVAEGRLELVGNGEGLRVRVPDGQLLMMGDNRNNSSDSRFWGPLDRSEVVGRAMFRFWPLARIGWVR